jgi:hypothetical protein
MLNDRGQCNDYHNYHDDSDNDDSNDNYYEHNDDSDDNISDNDDDRDGETAIRTHQIYVICKRYIYIEYNSNYCKNSNNDYNNKDCYVQLMENLCAESIFFTWLRIKDIY